MHSQCSVVIVYKSAMLAQQFYFDRMKVYVTKILRIESITTEIPL